MLKKSLAILFTALTILLCSNSASAKVDSVLIQNSITGEYLEYSYGALIEDYTNNLLGMASPLYDEYTKNVSGLKAFKDSIKGYVDYSDVVNDYTEKLLVGKGTEFNIDKFTEQANESMIISPSGKIRYRILKNSTVEDDSSIDVSSDFDVVSID